MNISDKFILNVLKYIESQGEPVSLDRYERKIIYFFKMPDHPGTYLRYLIEQEYVVLSGNRMIEMRKISITDKGRSVIEQNKL